MNSCNDGRRPLRDFALGMKGVLVLCALALSLAAHGGQTYCFAVTPQFEQRKLFQIWTPILAEVSRRSGLELNLVTPLTVSEFERDLARGVCDFVYANPYQLVHMPDSKRYLPLVHDKSPLRGIVVVRQDSPVQSPAELAGKTLAIPSYNAVGASLLARADLEHLFKAKVTPVVVKTHSSVYLNVANGLVDAGGGVEKTFQQQDPEVRAQLRILYTTRDMPSHPVAANRRVPAQARERLKQAFLDMAATPEGRALLAEVPMTEVVPTSLGEFLPMRKWGLEAYWVD